MLRSIALAAGCLLALSLSAPAASAGPTAPAPSGGTTTPTQAGTAVIAHRGASAYAPENTLPAVRLGVDMRADLVEIDVQRTKDGRLVVMHDTTLARTTDVEQKFPDRAPWRIADFTLDEIRTLDAGSWKSPEYGGTPVPTFEEVLDQLEPTGTGLQLEMKEPGLYPGIGEQVAAELERRPHWLRPDPEERLLVVQSFDRDFVRSFHQRMPQVRVGVLGAPAPEQLGEVATYANQVNPHHLEASPEYVTAVHSHGMTINPYTVDDPATMRVLIERGVDGIISNRPDVLRDEVG